MIPIEIDRRRLLNELTELGQIGADPAGGVTRLAYSPADLEARSWFTDRAQSCGLEVSIDPIGNILALEPWGGREPPVLSGSHLDTVPHGGRFDGMLGVMSALEAIRSIRSRTDLRRRRPLGVLVLAAEESSRFGAACLGSRTIVKDLQQDELNTLLDAHGVSLYEALNQAGLAPDRFSEAQHLPGWFYEFVEIHIDQADDLSRAGVPLGVITAIAAPTRLWIKFQGQQAHSGAMQMHKRRDAMAGAAELVLAVEAAARAYADRGIVGTVGVLRVQPGSMNTVPGLAELGIDIRGIDPSTIDDVVQQVTQATHRVAEKRDLSADVSVLWRSRPVQVLENRLASLEEACQAVGAKQMRLVSRSAHDAMYLGQHGPVSMLFIRNPAGISHNPNEDARDEDIILGAAALSTYLAWRAGQDN
jgi:hydantoinase/carbamoylase family amidase